MALNGIILINKARGVSSNSVVTKVQRLLKIKTAGHLGTLDVLGEGLLPIALGKGTKLFDYF
ncbi:MAG: tRNA pseudouridine(55) synthase TruB, partial [Clostridia bacterium]|nr:tRNA pseudouridine(55) synthase TruB [Clostridia bacterium]